MFFYIGTRSENKFYKYYNNEIENTLEVDECLNYFIKGQYLVDTCGYLMRDSYVGDVPQETTEGNKFDEYTEEIITDNKFLTFHHGEGGFTTKDINEYNELNTVEYNVLNDITNNALGFLLNDNGSISYRYLVKNSKSKNGYEILEEKTKTNVIKSNQWNDILIKLKPINNQNMKIFIYVDGYLIFISKELPILNLRKFRY